MINEEDIKKLETKLIKLRAYENMYKDKLKELEEKENKITKDIELIEESVKIMQDLSLNLKDDIIHKFEALITEGIREVFEENYEFKIEIKKNMNKIAASLNIILPNGKMVDIYSGEGGGIKDFISVLIRIIYFILDYNKKTPILFLDENLKHLDKKRALKAINFIKNLCKKLGIQVFLITHLDIDINELDTNIIKVC